MSSGTLLSTLDAVCTGVPLLGEGAATACSCDLDAASASEPGAGRAEDDRGEETADGDRMDDGDDGPRSEPPTPPSAPAAAVREGEGSGAPTGEDGSAMAVGRAVTPSSRSAFGTGDATDDCSGFIGVVVPAAAVAPLAGGDIGLAGDWARPFGRARAMGIADVGVAAVEATAAAAVELAATAVSVASGGGADALRSLPAAAIDAKCALFCSRIRRHGSSAGDSSRAAARHQGSSTY